MKLSINLASAAICCIIGITLGQYKPNWESLDSRPLPSWYDEAKIGIFIHWGVFSVPSFGSEWFWTNWHSGQADYVNFMKKNYPPNFTYADFAPKFTTEFFNPNQWADIFKASGANYIVLTSKHHEGFTNWPSNVSFNWNSMDVGPKRDLVGELANAVRNRTKIHFGLYHSLFEWFHPLYLKDKANSFKTQYFVKEKTMPELFEIVNTYKPDVVWSDGDWEVSDKYWMSQEFLAWLYNESPVKDTVVTNDRWGSGDTCHHGGFYTCSDRYNPGVLQHHKWENAMTIDKVSWGYRRNAPLSDYYTIEGLLQVLAETVSTGGNLLMNIGPTHDGRIVPIFEERLRQMGSWLSVNGEAIYSTQPWTYQNDTVAKNVWYTSNKSTGMVYAILSEWPGEILNLGAPDSSALRTQVSLLGYQTPLKWVGRPGGGMVITIPSIPIDKMPCQWSWVIKFSGLL